jgi:hypothetical protein
MAELNREDKLRERRADKQARRDARKRTAADGEPRYDVAGQAPVGIEEAVDLTPRL